MLDIMAAQAAGKDKPSVYDLDRDGIRPGASDKGMAGGTQL